MKSYIVKLIYNIQIGNGSHNSQFDEQTVFLNANNFEDAFYQARAQGKRMEDKFSNHADEQVEWKFVDVLDVFELSRFKNGEPLYTTTHETTDSSTFIKFIQHKSQIVQTKLLSFS